MEKVIIIGGGFAGLSAGVFLSKAGFKVEVLEASQKLGGRAYSFTDKETNTIIDNGQHILMGCYNETLDFLNLIGAKNNFNSQKKLKVNFLKENFKVYTLEAKTNFYPFNLLSGLLNYKAITLYERFKLLSFFLKIYFYSGSLLEKISIEQWLLLEKQNENIRKAFWEILAVGSLNTNIKNASAKVFSDILKKIFFRSNKAAAIILPKFGLSEMYCLKSKEFIESRNGKIILSETVDSVKLENNKIKEIKTNKRNITDFNYVVFAIPFYSLNKILNNKKEFNFLDVDLQYSAILNVHIWLKENNLEKTFYGLINSSVHWIFNHGTHLTIVISDANHLIDKSKEELFELISTELEKFIRIKKEDILNYQIIKEKRSTFVPSNEILGKRPNAKTNIKNLYLAGDWIETGLPSTIESAVKSGKIVSEIIPKNH